MITHSEWQQRFLQQKQSGLSISAWCKREGIRENQFYYWHKRIGNKGVTRDEGRFVRLDQPESVEVILGENLKVRIPANFDGASLRRLLEVLGC